MIANKLTFTFNDRQLGEALVRYVELNGNKLPKNVSAEVVIKSLCPVVIDLNVEEHNENQN